MTALTVNAVNTQRTEYGVYLTANCGKISAMIGITDHGIRVVCVNASHRAWRGAGRHFEDIAAALTAYKRPEMRAMILVADALNS